MLLIFSVKLSTPSSLLESLVHLVKEASVPFYGVVLFASLRGSSSLNTVFLLGNHKSGFSNKSHFQYYSVVVQCMNKGKFLKILWKGTNGRNRLFPPVS